MSIFPSSAVVISSKPASRIDTGYGVIAYKNIIDSRNISSTSSRNEKPITNLGNPSTAFTWEAANTDDQTISITSNGSEIDYIGIARHNLNQDGLLLEVRFNGHVVVPAKPIAAEQSILFLISSAFPEDIEIIISGASKPVSMGVLYIGKAVRLQRKIQVGHTPITYGRNRKTITGISENGQYLGEIVVRETKSTKVSLSNLTPEWYRNYLDPYFKLLPRIPCFFAWRPDNYPDEVGFCWVEGDPKPTNQSNNGMMSVSWSFKGIA